MKLNFEKIFFYFMLVIVSGSIGYAIKPAEPVKENSNSSQIRECVQAMHMMSDASKKNYYTSTAKSKKQVAIERMMSN
jgi:hypothetical protein